MTEKYCDASFNYVGTDGPIAMTQPVLDGRTVAEGGLPFVECGFERIDAPSSVDDWRDATLIDKVAGPEFDEVARHVTGADRIVVLPTIVRNPDSAQQTQDFAPITFVHSDFTDDFYDMVTNEDRTYREFLLPSLEPTGLTQADLGAASRLMLLQSWRNVGPVRPDFPLAFCDARCVTDPSRRTGLFIPEYGGRHLEFEAFVFSVPDPMKPDKWYTFPSLSSDEAVLIRTYDSARAAAGKPFWTPHSAFADPSVPSGPQTRRASVEMRALCVWD